ncbi:GNAT family N-acetyltransferase [Natrialbaceae archaeon GCM10025810]|uniref:GNAT family N-acetyltransferase n=1 Tax=Halovalidus salilacus TaxID=3075124 RepID=UPI00360F34CA
MPAPDGSSDHDVRIELATADDLEAVVDCWVRLAREQRRYGSYVLPEANRETMFQTLGAYRVDDGLLVARLEGDSGDERDVEREYGRGVVGFTSFSIERGALELEATRGHLSNLYVVPEFRGRGIGTRLLEAVEDALADRGVDAVILEAMAGNEAARRFYGRAGYVPFRVGMERRLEDDTNDDADADEVLEADSAVEPADEGEATADET